MMKSSLLLFTSAEAGLYGYYQDYLCYQGHGGTPLEPGDKPLKNTTPDVCESHCDDATGCVGFFWAITEYHDYSNFRCDCYFRSAINVTQCDVQTNRGFSTAMKVAPPPLKGNVMYHPFEPKYTGVANKDAGDFKGDAGFIFNTFQSFEKGNPESSMDHNVIEMSLVNVTGWGQYEECNAPGAEGLFTCPDDSPTYCCTTFDPKNHSHNIPAKHTRDQLPGLEVSTLSLGSAFGFAGFWFSFPAESQNVTWTEKLLRRVSGKCLGAAWRKDAGGCPECAGDALNQCVASCIKGTLCVNGSTDLLEATWNRVFSDPSECPDVPLPSKEKPFPNGMEDFPLVVV